ncbi:hypothetical protein MtrunA17_Chr8g0363101 [Medicago truncatula]|uniref:DUF569 domain-containing protein n=1 Tax=Medicago truncatula TaxID=3880 RepID=A0A396GKV3_MEDTR|nr:hypothetical protein MtrunA17_Chr8g0362901 [Medicago truncatula]RHN41163.1 hypothetical protein MtrunA17_Chr8g0363101 [Medicago truncatula]
MDSRAHPYDNIIRLKSCYNKYLTASNQPLLLGVTGRKLIQTLPRTLQENTAIKFLIRIVFVANYKFFGCQSTK